jgi:hypothetical protein
MVRVRQIASSDTTEVSTYTNSGGIPVVVIRTYNGRVELDIPSILTLIPMLEQAVRHWEDQWEGG